MSTQRSSGVQLRVRNIGGIDSTSVTFDPGITVLAGRNATNRTSLLKAIMAALGSEETALKSDADDGEVELTIGEETYTRQLTRQGTSVRTDGDPYLEDPELADLFAFLLESNEARRAVARGDDLREIIMRPVDTAEIQARITQLQAERRDLEDELDAIGEQADRLPSLEDQRSDLQAEIESTRETLAELEAEIEAADVDETATDQDDELEATLAELRSTRESLDDVRYELETERESLASLEAELEDLEVTDVDPDEIEDELEWLETRLDRERSRKSDLDARLDDLQSIIRFNEETLEDRDPDVSLSDSGSVTEQLAADRTVTCWTCGTEVERGQIESTIGQLRELRQDLLADRKEVQAEIDDHSERRRELQSKLEERDRTIERRESLRTERETRQDRIDELEDRAATLEAEIDELEAAVDELDTDDHGEVVDKHKRANELEFDLGRKQQRLESIDDEIERIERRLDERESVSDRIDEINDELESLRTRVEDVEREAVEQFNHHMDELVDVLGYSNIERIWIERRKRDAGRGGTPDSSFELHVVRTTDDGTTYEDVVGNLSESEREITGLVFALAGYLVHDVYETVPFMLLDSLEAIDAERIATLLEYLGDYAEHLVVALLTEDARAVDDRHQRIESI